MGTTQRIIPGVSGEPNWGVLNKAVTHIAKSVEKENAEKDNAQAKDAQQIAREHKRVMDRRSYHLKSVFSNLIKTGGGVNQVVRGRSRSMGKAGLHSASRISNFFASVGAAGLKTALNDIGFGNLAGKNVQSVIDYLLVYCSDSNTGMDETAASKASCEVLNELAAESNNDLNAFETLIKEMIEGKGLSDLLCRFWGFYIFEHLSQRFQEKITQQRGEEVSSQTFKIIKDDILGQVRVLNETRPVAKIDWKGSEGAKEMERIFKSIIELI